MTTARINFLFKFKTMSLCFVKSLYGIAGNAFTSISPAMLSLSNATVWFNPMHKLPAIISVFILGCFLIFPGYVYAEDHSKSIPLILQSAEKFFIFLDERNFKAAWELMTEKSHQTIINDIYDISVDRGVDITKGDISKNVNSTGIIFNSYWQAFMTNFDPDVILNDRVWEFEKIESDYAVILLKKMNVTKLKMYKESNQWKVGLVETFWTRRHLKIISRIQSLFTR